MELITETQSRDIHMISISRAIGFRLKSLFNFSKKGAALTKVEIRLKAGTEDQDWGELTKKDNIIKTINHSTLILHFDGLEIFDLNYLFCFCSSRSI